LFVLLEEGALVLVDYLIWKCCVILCHCGSFPSKIFLAFIFFTEDTVAAILSERSHLSHLM